MKEEVKDQILSAINERLSEFIPLAEQLGRSRFLVYESEVHAPGETEAAYEREDTEMEAIAESFRCEIKQSDNQFSLMFYMQERDPGGFLEIVDSGMPPPLVGGDNGAAHNPNGTIYPSDAPKAAYGLPLDGMTRFGKTILPDYSKEATGVIHEIKTMLKDLFHGYFQDAITEAKNEILQAVKEDVKSKIHETLVKK